MPDKVNGPALAAVAAGSVFVLAGIKGVSVMAALRNLIAGKPLPAADQPITGTGSGTAGGVASGPVKPGYYSHAGLMKLWQQAGGSADSANNAACHAIQESSGNPKITSANPDGGTNVGLWQLDTRGVGAGHSIAQLQNPMVNAILTVQATGNGRNWSQWATPGC